MRNLIKRLEKKEWSKKDIAKVVHIIKKAKQNKVIGDRFLDKRIYWIMLVVIIAANFAISIAFIPMLIALSGLRLFAVIVIIGVAFGLLFEHIIRTIENLEKKHEIILAFLIPLIAFANVFAITKISNEIVLALGLKNVQQPVIVALLYAIFFALPYIIYRFVLKIEYYSAR